MKKVLICGISGQLGSALKKSFSTDFDVYGLDMKSTDDKVFNCDITNKEKVEKVINELKPDVVINTAALVHADRCETEKHLTYNINYLGNKNILEACKKIEAYFVFISSYYVFDGTNKEYSENDMPTPMNYYGIMKLLAENDTSHYTNSLIIRPCKIFSLGYDTRNFIARTYTSLKNGEKVVAISDQYNNPISADFISSAIKQLVLKNKHGVFNIGGTDYVNNVELAKLFASHFNLDASLISGILTNDTKQVAPRPKHVMMKLSKLESVGIKTYSLKDMFDKLFLPKD